MIRIILTLTTIILFSCTTPSYQIQETMLPNGDWTFILSSDYSCESFYSNNPNESEPNKPASDLSFFKRVFEQTEPTDNTSNSNNQLSKCIYNFKNEIGTRASKLCPKATYELYGCASSENTNSLYLIKCYMRCT